MDSRKECALRSCSVRRTRGHSAAYFHLRPWPSGAGSHCVRPKTFSRRSGCTSVSAALSCRRLRLRYKKLKIYRLYLGTLMSASPLIDLTIDGKKVSVPAGTTVFDAARINDIAIPTLCHQQNERPVGVCRVCVVDVGARVFTASCVRPVEPGMVVTTNSERVKQARSTLVELLMADHPSPCARERQSGDCELEALAKQNGRLASRYAPLDTRRGVDESSMSIGVDFDACILCDRCIRGCSEVRENFVLGRMGKGTTTRIAF